MDLPFFISVETGPLCTELRRDEAEISGSSGGVFYSPMERDAVSERILKAIGCINELSDGIGFYRKQAERAYQTIKELESKISKLNGEAIESGRVIENYAVKVTNMMATINNVRAVLSSAEESGLVSFPENTNTEEDVSTLLKVALSLKDRFKSIYSIPPTFSPSMFGDVTNNPQSENAEALISALEWVRSCDENLFNSYVTHMRMFNHG